jgi:hypothetical protein
VVAVQSFWLCTLNLMTPLSSATEHLGRPGPARALAIANGDFAPLRKPHVDFDALVLKDGIRLPLHTSVSEGVPNVVHLTAGATGKKKGRVRGAVEAAEQKAKDQVHQTVERVTAPGKWDRLKAAIAAELPYRGQWLTAGTQFTAGSRADTSCMMRVASRQFIATDRHGQGNTPCGPCWDPPGNLVCDRKLTNSHAAFSAPSEECDSADRDGRPVRTGETQEGGWGAGAPSESASLCAVSSEHDTHHRRITSAHRYILN